jgi:archaellum component FlaC
MGKLLRVLVIFFLLLSAGALTLGYMLFGKRELLKGRTQKLEKTIIQLGPTLEAASASADRRPEYPARDISPVTSEVIETPELSTFWDTYSNAVEMVDQATLDLNKKRFELMNYYKIDPATQQPARDALQQKITEGEGTMQAVLDDVVAKSAAQLVRLNDTRRQLVATRTELVSVITELNQHKKSLRAALKEIEGLKADVARLTAEVAKLKTRIDELTEEKKTLEDQVAEEKRKVALMEEQIKEKDGEIESQKKEIKRLTGIVGNITQQRPETQPITQDEQEKLAKSIQSGEKGAVVAVDAQWNFVVLQLTDEFLKELLGPDLSKPVPGFELMIKRPGEGGKFVTKVKLVSVRKAERLAIADVLTNWKQMPVEKGDVVFHQ